VANRVTHNAVEALTPGGTPNARISHNAVEVLHTGVTAVAYVTHNAVEVLSTIDLAPPATSAGAHVSILW
jgi:hypothetical protein